MSSQALTPEQAYLAMFAFLQNYWERGRSDDIAALLGSMSLLADGKPTDRAIASDWNEAVRIAVSAKLDAGR